MPQILIIEPDKNLLEKISSYLTELGYNTLTSENGSTGVQMAIQHKPDMILSDTNPYELTGQEVFSIVRQVNTTSVIPFVFLTTKGSYNELRSVMNLGVDDVIVKPFELDELRKLLEVRLNRQNKLMEKAEKRFSHLIDYANTAICIYCEKQIEYINHKFCEIVGYSKNELVGMNMINLVYKDDIPHVIDKINRIFRGIQTDMKIIFRAIRKNREIIQLIYSARLVEFEGTKNLVGSIDQANTISKQYEQTENGRGLDLTTREKDVLFFICQGKTNQEIANKLNISVRTVEGHRYRLLKKSNCTNSVCLAVYAIKEGLYRI